MNIVEQYLQQKDARCRPSWYDLRPDKIVHLSLGPVSSPEGWCDVASYGWGDKRKFACGKICWKIEDGVSFWVTLLSSVPATMLVDGFNVQIVDYQPGPQTYGYGPKWMSKTFESIDDVFEWMVGHDDLRPFFFPKGEHQVLRLNDYSVRSKI